MTAYAADEPLFSMPRELWHLRRCPVCGGALSVAYLVTYVVPRQCWVKIGATNDARRRINELSRPAWAKHLLSPEGMDWLEPLVVIAVIDGDVEHALHERFADVHARGEWFLPGPEMRLWLASLEPVAARGEAS